MIAGWDSKHSQWITNVERASLDGLSFSTPSRFESIVFAKLERTDAYRRKQFLNEYMAFGISDGEYKTLRKDIKNEKYIEFSIAAPNWNEILIGATVEIEGFCKILEKDKQEEKILKFTFTCSEGQVLFEVGFGDDHYEEYECGIKDFLGYYKE